MARVHAKSMDLGFDKTTGMPAPKRPELIEEWFKQARRVIPEIPDPKKSDWFIKTHYVTGNYLTFEMLNSIGERCAVTVLRSVPHIV